MPSSDEVSSLLNGKQQTMDLYLLTFVFAL